MCEGWVAYKVSVYATESREARCCGKLEQNEIIQIITSCFFNNQYKL